MIVSLSSHDSTRVSPFIDPIYQSSKRLGVVDFTLKDHSIYKYNEVVCDANLNPNPIEKPKPDCCSSRDKYNQEIGVSVQKKGVGIQYVVVGNPFVSY